MTNLVDRNFHNRDSLHVIVSDLTYVRVNGTLSGEDGITVKFTYELDETSTYRQGVKYTWKERDLIDVYLDTY